VKFDTDGRSGCSNRSGPDATCNGQANALRSRTAVPPPPTANRQSTAAGDGKVDGYRSPGRARALDHASQPQLTGQVALRGRPDQADDDTRQRAAPGAAADPRGVAAGPLAQPAQRCAHLLATPAEQQVQLSGQRRRSHRRHAQPDLLASDPDRRRGAAADPGRHLTQRLVGKIRTPVRNPRQGVAVDRQHGPA